MSEKAKFLVVEARFYPEISASLLSRAQSAFEEVGVEHETVQVFGALEIPGAIAIASQKDESYAGYVALGCVVRGETYHYDIVCNESARGLMDLTVRERLAIGNGILTVETMEQARMRAPAEGWEATQAAINLARLAGSLS